MDHINWGYIADRTIYVLGYAFIIFLTYAVFNYYIEYSRSGRTTPASLKERITVYFSAILFAALIAALFSLKAKHQPERFLISFFSLIVPALLGLMNGFKEDDRLTYGERLQRKEIRGNRDINKET